MYYRLTIQSQKIQYFFSSTSLEEIILLMQEQKNIYKNDKNISIYVTSHDSLPDS